MEVMVMARERLKLMLNQVTEAMVMVDMVMEEAMEVMVDTEAMGVMVMARERLKLMLNQVTEAMVMVDMVMEEAMEVMVDTEADAEPGYRSYGYGGYGYGRSYGGYGG